HVVGGARPGRIGEAGRVGDEGEDRPVGGGVEDAVATRGERAADGGAGWIPPERRAVAQVEGEDVAGERADVDDVAGAVGGRGGGLVGKVDGPADAAVGAQRDGAAVVGAES